MTRSMQGGLAGVAATVAATWDARSGSAAIHDSPAKR